MICPKCQVYNQEGTQFCTACGNLLITPAPPPVITPASTPTPSFTDNLFIMSIIGFACGGGLLGVLVFYLIWSRGWERAKKIKVTIIYLVTLYLLATIFYVGLFKSAQNIVHNSGGLQSSTSNFPSVTVPTSQTPTPNILALAKYDIDSNRNAIPDFVETALGWNPTVDKCKEEACGKSATGNESVGKKNILLILDSSGSMAESLVGEQKMAAAKNALTDYVNSLQNNMNVALIVYGNHGSNSAADKAVSCKGIDILYPLGPVDKTKFTQAINSFQPTGWTPIGDALRKAKNEVFAGHESENNYIILVTDGIETCDSNPVGAVQELEASGVKPIVSVIGLAINSGDQGQLQQIANFGGGKYYSVNNSKELAGAFSSNFKDQIGVSSDILCLTKNAVSYNLCIGHEYFDANQYLNKLWAEVNLNNPTEGNKIREIQSTMNAKYSEFQKAANSNYQNNFNERQNTINDLQNQQKNLNQ